MRKIAVFFVSSRTRMLFFLLAVEILLLSFSSRYFLSIQNLIELTQFGAVLLLLALGESIVMLSGREGIDLSIGAILSLSGVIFGLLIRAGAGLMIALGLTVVVGFFFGFVNGLLISVVKIPSLIATLGTH